VSGGKSKLERAVPAGPKWDSEKTLADCVILENCKAMAILIPARATHLQLSLKRWEQFWVDNVGGNIFLSTAG